MMETVSLGREAQKGLKNHGDQYLNASIVINVKLNFRFIDS